MYLVTYDNIKFKYFSSIDDLIKWIDNYIKSLVKDKDIKLRHCYYIRYCYNEIFIGGLDNMIISFRNTENSENYNDNQINNINSDLSKIIHNRLNYLPTWYK